MGVTKISRLQRHQCLCGTPLNTNWLEQIEKLEINQF